MVSTSTCDKKGTALLNSECTSVYIPDFCTVVTASEIWSCHLRSLGKVILLNCITSVVYWSDIHSVSNHLPSSFYPGECCHVMSANNRAFIKVQDCSFLTTSRNQQKVALMMDPTVGPQAVVCKQQSLINILVDHRVVSCHRSSYVIWSRD